MILVATDPLLDKILLHLTFVLWTPELRLGENESHLKNAASVFFLKGKKLAVSIFQKKKKGWTIV